jgi:Rieske Fe-S protein
MIDEQNDADGVSSRRGFLVRSFWGVVAVIGAGLAVLGLPPAIAPALRKTASTWSPVIDADLAPEGMPTRASITVVAQDAFLPPEPRETPVFVINHGNGNFAVMDARCTHLGCPVSWSAAQDQFLCPCHEGVFDAQGKVVSGPPPRPLDLYEWEVRDGVLYAGPPIAKGES